MAYRYCCVPGCKSSTSRTPGKLFFSLPRDEEKRIQWMLSINRPDISMLSKSSNVCEDHFRLEDDLENYLKFKLQYGRHRLKPDAVPHVFNCFSTHPIKIEPEEHDDDPKSEPESIKTEQEHEVDSQADPIKVEPEEHDNDDPKSEPESIKTEPEDHEDNPLAASDVYVAVKGEPEVHTEETHVLVPEVFIAVKGEPDDPEGDSFCEEKSLIEEEPPIIISPYTNFPEIIVSPDDESNGTRKHVHGPSLLCTHCDFQTRCATKLRNHISVHHPGTTIANGVVLWFYCSECGQGPFNAISLKRHVLRVHERKRREKERKRIVREKQDSIRFYRCSECEYAGGTKRHLEEHFDSKHSDVKPFSCSQCDFKTGRKGSLRKHVLHLHTYLGIHRCPKCDFSTSYHKSLEIHIARKHTEVPKYGCPECEFSAALKKTLQKHVLEVHVGKRSFPCSLCPYKAEKASDLKIHVKVKHPRLYNCSKCDFSVSDRVALKEHVASHRKEKPSHRCPHCTFSAPSYRQLSLHEKDKHPKVKEPAPRKRPQRIYQCSYEPCSYKSLSRLKLEIHMTSRHGVEYPYYCHSCGRGVNSFQTLQRHFTSQHKNEAIPEWLRTPFGSGRRGRRPLQTKKT